MAFRGVEAFFEEGDLKSMSFILCEGLRGWPFWDFGILRKLRLGLPSKDSSDAFSVRLKAAFTLFSNPKTLFLLLSLWW